MNSSLFARPSLKLVLLGAVFVLVANDVFVALRTRARGWRLPFFGGRGVVSEEELGRLRQFVMEHPSSEGFLRLSYLYQRRGEFRKAKACLWQADRLADARE